MKLIALGSSQLPLIREGDTLEIAPVAASAIRVGDLIAYRCGHFRVCHRVLAISAGRSLRFLTKGDASLMPDGWINASAVLGRLIRVRSRSIHRPSFRVVSAICHVYSRLQWGLYRRLFLSRAGRRIGRWRARLIPRPIFQSAFIAVFAPLEGRSARGRAPRYARPGIGDGGRGPQGPLV